MYLSQNVTKVVEEGKGIDTLPQKKEKVDSIAASLLSRKKAKSKPVKNLMANDTRASNTQANEGD